MAQFTVDDIIHQASRLSQSEKERIVEALSANPVSPSRKRLDVYGQFAHVSTSVNDFLFRKAADIRSRCQRSHRAAHLGVLIGELRILRSYVFSLRFRPRRQKQPRLVS